MEEREKSRSRSASREGERLEEECETGEIGSGEVVSVEERLYSERSRSGGSGSKHARVGHVFTDVT